MQLPTRSQGLGDNPAATASLRRPPGFFRLPGGYRGTMLIAVLCAVLLVGGTLAFMTALTGTVENQFIIGTSDTTIEEEFEESNPWAGKEVSLVNNGNMPGVVRVMILPILTGPVDGDFRGGSLGEIGEPDGDGILEMGDFVFEFDSAWSSLWTYKEDGYFYYNRVLEPGEATPPLLDKVSVRSGMTPEETIAFNSKYQGVELTVEVLSDIIGLSGDEEIDAEALAIWGATVIDGNVQY